MSSGSLPPVPDLIPIAVLLKTPGNNNSGPRRECAPCAEVMGEQRSRRTGRQPSADLIDSARSRGPSAAPQTPPQSRKHRKSDRRREHRKPARPRSGSKHSCKSREASTPASSPERPPRVNPIFVWVRQEDTRIVDVKCEDYDKRNRILLTKTAQGWRAIPRTETLVPSLKEVADNHRHHHHHRHRKDRKSKVRRRSAAVQVDSDIQDLDQEDETPSSPTWTSPVNVESHLPSHKIHVPQKCPSPAADSPSVNSAVSDSAQSLDEKCSVAKLRDVTPLDNLLAVAEFEFNQQMQSGEWDKSPQNDEDKSFEIDDEQKEFISNMEQLSNLIIETQDPKSEDCDYNEDDDNNLAMDDILSRLEQSLRSPSDTTEADDNIIDYNSKAAESEADIKEMEEDCFTNDISENNYDTSVPEQEEESKEDYEKNTNIVESSTTIEEEPTDLSIKLICNDNNECNYLEQPTDLTLPKNIDISSPIRMSSPRPQSQNSEAIQSPQPSGIPAVPPSPDLVSTSANSNHIKSKSVFLETLLTSSTQNQTVSLNSEVTIIRQKEPLDLGTSRKSASPTITCSEEVKKCALSSDCEPSSKKFKPADITLKTLLDVEAKSADGGKKETNKSNKNSAETPRLLELLKTDLSEPDPLTQLRQIFYDANLNVPDPMLVPKERLSQIISHPGREIPKLLKQRPELRLPEALAFPHLLQDPDILVITLQQLETIILKQNQSISLKDIRGDSNEKIIEKCQKKQDKNDTKESSAKNRKLDESSNKHTENQSHKSFNELASDIDAATTAAFNQMVWLPYLNQLEAMSFGSNSELMKMLSNSMPMYHNQVPDINHLVSANRFPPPVNFSMQQPHMNYNNQLEMSMWQEAVMQANMLRPKMPFDGLNSKNSFRDYLDQLNFTKATASGLNNKLPMMTNKPNMSGNFHPSNSNNHATFQNSFLNLPHYQGNNLKQNVQVPPYNLFGHKNMNQHQQKNSSHPYLLKQRYEGKTNFGGYHQHKMEERHKHQEHKPKLSCKPFANAVFNKHGSTDLKEKSGSDFFKHHQPIDLSGSTAPASKLKVKQHLIDPVNAPKLLKHDDIPEVGSTTASVEEMQDAHKHLWHPLFGNQKGYHSPWNWSTVTATGE